MFFSSFLMMLLSGTLFFISVIMAALLIACLKEAFCNKYIPKYKEMFDFGIMYALMCVIWVFSVQFALGSVRMFL